MHKKTLTSRVRRPTCCRRCSTRNRRSTIRSLAITQRCTICQRNRWVVTLTIIAAATTCRCITVTVCRSRVSRPILRPTTLTRLVGRNCTCLRKAGGLRPAQLLEWHRIKTRARMVRAVRPCPRHHRCRLKARTKTEPS